MPRILAVLDENGAVIGREDHEYLRTALGERGGQGRLQLPCVARAGHGIAGHGRLGKDKIDKVCAGDGLGCDERARCGFSWRGLCVFFGNANFFRRLLRGSERQALPGEKPPSDYPNENDGSWQHPWAAWIFRHLTDNRVERQHEA